MSEQRLREYIENDRAYQEYKLKKPTSEYIRLHISLCRDIENILDENQQLKNDNAVMKANLIQIRDERLERYKTVLDEIREYINKCCFIENGEKVVFQEDIEEILDKVKENERVDRRSDI